jgi:hypothetical protein
LDKNISDELNKIKKNLEQLSSIDKQIEDIGG